MTSKYDYAKIKVVLQEENYFILSRFLLSKMLLFCQVPPSIAVRVSLDIKKHFVDEGHVTITEHQLREELFRTMRRHGCGDAYIDLFNRLSEFQTARVPLIVFIAGTGCCGKSSIAHILGSKLSNFHVINTDMVMETLCAIDALDGRCPALADGDAFCCSASAGAVQPTSFWLRQYAHSELVDAWRSMCACVAQSIEREIHKALCEGKALIIEGTFLDLRLYASYILPSLLEQKLAELATQTSHKQRSSRKKASGRPIILCALMLLPDVQQPFVLDHWLAEQTHRCVDDVDASAVDVDAAEVWRRFGVVQAAHLRRIDEGVPVPCSGGVDGGPLPLQPCVTKVVFDARHTSDVAMALHEEVLHRICQELDRQRGPREATVAPDNNDVGP